MNYEKNNQIVVVESSFDDGTLYSYFGSDEVIEEWIIENSNETLVIDFSGVTFWEVTALLWLVVALKHHIDVIAEDSKNIKILLKLPDYENEQDEKKKVKLHRSADFLRRWRFDDALINISPRVSDILVESQSDYFPPLVKGKRKTTYFQPKSVTTDSRAEEDLISNGLVEIQNLAEHGRISHSLLNKFTQKFAADRIADVLIKKCGISKDLAQSFTIVLVGEGTANIREHPGATMGFVSMAKDNKGNLVLAMVDDGEPIQKTLYPTYADHLEDIGSSDLEILKSFKDDLFSLPFRIKSNILSFATEFGVSSKYTYADFKNNVGAYEIGNGLGLIKETATSDDEFAGELRIISGGINTQFASSRWTESNEIKLMDTNISRSKWKGNVIKVSIPLEKRTDSRYK